MVRGIFAPSLSSNIPMSAIRMPSFNRFSSTLCSDALWGEGPWAKDNNSTQRWSSVACASMRLAGSGFCRTSLITSCGGKPATVAPPFGGNASRVCTVPMKRNALHSPSWSRSLSCTASLWSATWRTAADVTVDTPWTWEPEPTLVLSRAGRKSFRASSNCERPTCCVSSIRRCDSCCCSSRSAEAHSWTSRLR